MHHIGLGGNVKITENQITKLIRASLKSNSGQQLNEAPFFVLLGPALKALGAAIGSAALIYGAEKAVGFMIEKHRVKEVSKAINVDDIQIFLKQYVNMLDYAKSCGETGMEVELTKFRNLCETILDEIKIDFSIYPNFIETLQLGVEGIATVDTLKKGIDHYKNRGSRGEISVKQIKRFGEKALKRVAAIGAIMAAVDIGNQLYDTNRGVKDFKSMIKDKNFEEELKKFRSMHEEMEKGNLPCYLRDLQFR